MDAFFAHFGSIALHFLTWYLDVQHMQIKICNTHRIMILDGSCSLHLLPIVGIYKTTFLLDTSFHRRADLNIKNLTSLVLLFYETALPIFAVVLGPSRASTTKSLDLFFSIVTCVYDNI